MDKRGEQDKARDCAKILDILAQIRQPYESMVDDIITYIHHGRRKIADKDARKGQKTGAEVYDGTALGALNLLSDGLHGYLVSPAMRWFSFTLPGKINFPRWSGMRTWNGKRMDEYPEVKRWLEDGEEVMYSAFLRSNFYDQTPEYFKDGASIGTVTMLCEEDVGNGLIIFTVPHFREGYIAENKNGMVDTYYRDHYLTLKQMVEKWGLETLMEFDPQFKTKYESNPHRELEVVRAIFPRSDLNAGRIDSKAMPWASAWMLKGGNKFIEEGGDFENPAITWRWRKNNDEWYGRGCGWDAFVETMVSQQMGRSNLRAGHKMVDRPMIGPADLRGQVQSDPGGWTWVAGDLEKKQPRPLNEKIELPFSVEMQERLDAKIKEHFHVDFFLMLSQAAFQKIDITATQVVEMQGEKAAILGTRIGRIQSEFLNPVIDRVFAIETRAGRIPEPPQILLDYAGKNLEVDYLGPLAQSQKRLFKTQSINTGITKVMQLASAVATVSPDAALELLDPIDMDETVNEILDSSGFPAKAMRDENQIKAIREMRAKQKQLQEMAAQANETGKMMSGLNKAVEPNSVADMMMGGQGREASA